MNKQQKAELRRLAGLAHERELGHWLRQLDAHFEAWKRGEIPASELGEHIHEFDRGPARAVWARHLRLKHPEKRVAWGLARGLLEESEIEPTLLAIVKPVAEVFREIDPE